MSGENTGNHKDVLILGGGLSAAYISAACKDLGLSFEVKTVAKSPFIFGAIWLRWLPDRIAEKHRLHNIHVIPIGTQENYVKKQWGKSIYGSSFPDNAVVEQGYNPNEVLNDLWATEGYHIVSSLTDEKIAKLSSNYAAVFMTFPTDACREDSKNYTFSTPCAVWNLNDGAEYEIPDYIGNKVFYMGNTTDVVRHSQLFGYVFVEYTHSHIPNVDNLGRYGKIHWFADLHPKTPAWDEDRVPAGNVYLVGRYAQRSRKVLAHEAYQRVVDIVRG